MSTDVAHTSTPAPPGLIGTGEKMREVLALIAAAAESDDPVLITGESGAGKQTVARAIHAASAARRGGPFVAVHCGALPEHLLESELFGHVRSGFAQPAPVVCPRVLEKARGGTVFLNAVEELPIRIQVLLLRFLQTRQFQRVGESEWIDSDVRVIASTLRDLGSLAREEKFREDLFYQLNVVHIDLPPLRERPEDIPLLAARFMERLDERQSRQRSISQEAMQSLASYRWPGNVRELESAIERACIVAEVGPIQPEHLPVDVGRA